jgi:hypothetical protein
MRILTVVGISRIVLIKIYLLFLHLSMLKSAVSLPSFDDIKLSYSSKKLERSQVPERSQKTQYSTSGSSYKSVILNVMQAKVC